jgi:hypothetical protein
MVAFENATVLRFYQPNFHLKHDQILTRRLAATSDLNKIEIGELQVEMWKLETEHGHGTPRDLGIP